MNVITGWERENLQWQRKTKIVFALHCFSVSSSMKSGEGPVSKTKWHSMAFKALGGSEVSQIFQCRNCDWILHAKLRVESEDVEDV